MEQDFNLNGAKTRVSDKELETRERASLEIHHRLKMAREMAGYRSAADAAKRLGVNSKTYTAHENGTRGMKMHSVDHYAKFFKVSKAWLLTGTGEPAKTNNILQLPPPKGDKVTQPAFRNVSETTGAIAAAL